MTKVLCKNEIKREVIIVTDMSTRHLCNKKVDLSCTQNLLFFYKIYTHCHL